MAYGQSITESVYSFGPDVPRERVTLGLPVISTDHALIHSGIAYTLTGTFGAATTVAAIGLKAPAAAKAAATIVMTDTDANLTYTFLTEGKEGNNWSVTHVDPEDTDQELVVTLAGRDITVSLATDEGGDITSLASEVAEAVNAHPEISKFIVCTVPGDDGGVNAVTKTSLSGGASNVFVHFKPIAVTAAADVVTILLHEVGSFTGTAVNPMFVPQNQNRTSSLTSDVTITASADATISTAGTGYKQVFSKVARGSAGGAARYAESVGSPEEIVLKPGVQYVLGMARAGSTAIDFELFWYEEESA
jgi:hypothetical protein